MSSIDDRLAASDPARAGYEHPAMNTMISRVLATGRPQRDATWRAFRLRVASAVAATGLVTGVGIAALSSAGVSLPVLSLAAGTHGVAPTSGKYSTSTAAPNVMLMPLQRNWQFTGADNLSNAPGVATVYSLSAPSDPAAALSLAAHVLGVDIGSPTSSDGGSSYTSTGSMYEGWLTVNGGVASWEIDLNPTPSDTSSSVTAAPDAFNATALADARQLGDFQLGAPSPQELGSDNTGPIDVTVPILVGGDATDMAYDFTFGADGTLQSADGVFTTASPVGDYPLISPAAGVDQIQNQLYVFMAPLGGGVAAPMEGSSSVGAPTPVGTPTTSGSNDAVTTTDAPPSGSTGAATPPGTSVPSSSDPTTTIAPTVVNLTAVATNYGAYNMSDGSTLLLPVYVYTGDVVGQGWQASFRVVPVDPAYLDLSKVVSPRLY